MMGTDGLVCRAPMLAGPAPRQRGAAAGRSRAPERTRLVRSWSSRVSASASGDTVVDRRLIDAVLAEPLSFLSGVRVAPEPGGSSVRLLGIRDGSLLHALGLRTGDALLSVNDADMTDLTRAVGAIPRLATEPRLVIRAIRASRPVTLTVDVR
jgi:hypothetical protein